MADGDRRSIGRANAYDALAQHDPVLFDRLIAGMAHENPLLAMRCADAAEKASARQPQLLQTHTMFLLRLLATAQQPEVRWHLAQMLPRLPMTARQAQHAFAGLVALLNAKSAIVRTMALQAMADLALAHPSLLPEARLHIDELAKIDSAAVRARAAKLQHTLSRNG